MVCKVKNVTALHALRAAITPDSAMMHIILWSNHTLSERQTVLIDMDGVQADFDSEVMERMTQQYPFIPLLGVRRNFYISDDYPEHRKLVLEISNEPGFFTSLAVVDNALEGWQRVIDLGYQPQVCSSPITANPRSEVEKLRWLQQHFAPVFGQYVVDTAIITKNKHEHNGVALIDDRPVVSRAAEANWQHIVFDKPYNQGTAGLRQYGWLDPNLADLLETASATHIDRR